MFARQIRFRWIVVFLSLPILLWGQGTYYAAIDTGSATFVTDLHNLIYPHTKISYDQFDETNIANFSSRDTTGGQKVVTCVYSGQNFVYTPPFAWLPFSREHTFCHSWMPTYSSESGPEYSDQHHLFPTNQNNANGVRSNHPLGIVSIPVGDNGTFLAARYGTNSIGETVYEPRDSHKGDAARALFYMSVCYNGVNGNDWSFNYLNNTRLPALSEAPQSVDLLIQWHNQDPPDDWERARNEYIYSIQNNRNPFVDHPEYVNIIDFNTLTKKTSTTLATEPSNYPGGFNTPTISSSSITVTWTDPSGEVLPSGYIVFANTTGSFSDPTDGATYTNDTNLSDGSAGVHVAYGVQSYTFTGLTSSTNYTFKIYPYNGTGGATNYKTTSFPSTLIQQYSTATGTSGAYISITSLTFSYTENFDVLLNTGTSNTWTDNVTVSGWYSSRTNYVAGTGSSNTGALYSYGSESATERSLGSTASGTTGTLLYAVRFKNNSGGTITSIPLTYTGEQWRNGGNTAVQSLAFEYKINASAINDASGWIAVPALNFESPVAAAASAALDGNAVLNKTHIAATVSVSLLNGEEIWFRWTDINDTGNDHGLSIDNFSFNPTGSLLPVELTSFAASILNNAVFLQWRTATELNNFGFELERCVASGPHLRGDGHIAWTKIGFVAGHGTTNAPKSYSFIDGNAQGTVAYRLKQIDRNGRFEYSHSVEITVAHPSQSSLGQNYPNPFNAETHIGFSLNSPGRTTLTVFNTIGQEVASLVNGHLDAGSYSVPFNGSSLSGGIYFYSLRSGNFTATKKFLLVK